MRLPFRKPAAVTVSDAPAGSGAPDLDEFLDAPRPKPWKRWLKIAAIVLVVALLALGVAQCFKPTPEGVLLTKPATRGDLTVTVTATGQLRPTNEVEVGSEASGIVTAVFVDNNDRVVKGQPLARVDTERLDDAITTNRAALNLAVAQVDQAEATAQASAANLNRLEEVYRLSGGKVPSKVELDNARADRARTVAAVRGAEAQVVQAPRPAVVGPDLASARQHLLARDRCGVEPPDRPGPDGRRLLPGSRAVHHRGGPGHHEAGGAGGRGRRGPGVRRPARDLHRRRLSRPALPRAGRAGGTWARTGRARRRPPHRPTRW